MNNKKIYLSLLFCGVISILFGVTYTFFNYTRTGSPNNFSVGRIFFKSDNEETITLNNLFPIDPLNATDMADHTKVGTYSIDITGDTDYVDGLEYLVSIVDSNISNLPISIDVSVSNGLGTSNDNYFTARESKNASIYKKLIGDTIVGDGMVLVGYVKPNTTSGVIEGVDGTITITAYLDKNKILISDTYDGTESDNMGTPNSMAQGKTVLTTAEWNALSTNGISFKVRVEANEGIWVNESLEMIMKRNAVMDNISSTYVSASTGIDFGVVSSDTNGKGVYMHAGTENNANPITYYRGDITDNNVLFNNICWKAVRTTDIGGVKLIYSGEPSDIYERIPLTESQYTIPSGAKNDFTFNSNDNSWEITIRDNRTKEINFTVPAGDGYKLVQTGTSGSGCGGIFEIYKNDTRVNLGINRDGSALNFIHNFGTLSSTDVIRMFYYGGSSSTCAVTFKLQMVQPGDLISKNGCTNSGLETHLNISGTTEIPFNTNYDSPAYVGYMYGDVYTYNYGDTTTGAYYGSGFTYNNGVYTLINTSTTIDGTHHYTCNLTTADGTCATIRYYFDDKYYINLTGGDGVEEAFTKMNTNTNNSNAKTLIDTWYANNMNTITNKLEDTVWCNDRSIGKYNGWSATGSWGTDWEDNSLLYGAFERSNYATNTSTVKNEPSLACANKNDSFTVSTANGNGALTYPVALLTEDELVLAGGVATNPSTFYLNNGYYWSMSPSQFNGIYAEEFYDETDYVSNDEVSTTFGLRPAISLKPGQPVISGDGTATNPYVIK